MIMILYKAENLSFTSYFSHTHSQDFSLGEEEGRRGSKRS